MKKESTRVESFCRDCANSYIPEYEAESGHPRKRQRCTHNVAICVLKAHAFYKAGGPKVQK